MRAALLALLAGLCAVSAAPAPAIDERAAPPAIYNKQGSLAVLGVGSTNSDYNETVDFNGQGTLALESSSGPFTLQVVDHTDNYLHAWGYVHLSAVTCLTAHLDSGRTSFKELACADTPNEGDDPEDLRRRQWFEMTPGGDTINLSLGYPDKGIPARSNVRIVDGTNEVHTTPDNTDHNYQLYLVDRR